MYHSHNQTETNMCKRFLLTLLILLTCSTALATDPQKGGTVVSTGAAAIASTFTPVRNVYVKSVRVHLSAAATQDTLTIVVDSDKGTAYDAVVVSQAMAGYADLVWLPDGEFLLEKGDALDVNFTNTDTRTYGVEIAYEY